LLHSFTICHHLSNFDAGAFPTSRMLLLKDVKGPAYACDLPYRCLIPKGIDGMLVTGLGVSADRDAMTLIRMQADLENQGYAAGTAAAMAAGSGVDVSKIDVRDLQKKLLDKGILEKRVLSEGTQDRDRPETQQPRPDLLCTGGGHVPSPPVHRVTGSGLPQDG